MGHQWLNRNVTKITILFNNLFFLSWFFGERASAETEENQLLNKVFFFFLCTQTNIFIASYHYCWPTNVSWTILTMPLLCFCALNVVVAFFSMCRVRKLSDLFRNIFIYILIFSDYEWRSYGFGMTSVWVIFGWTIPLKTLMLQEKTWLNDQRHLSDVCIEASNLKRSTDRSCSIPSSSTLQKCFYLVE